MAENTLLLIMVRWNRTKIYYIIDVSIFCVFIQVSFLTAKIRFCWRELGLGNVVYNSCPNNFQGAINNKEYC